MSVVANAFACCIVMCGGSGGTFGSALSELQRNVGSAFAPMQGGTYASPRSESIVAELHELGMPGVGQSSWGPTLYAFSAFAEAEQAAVARRIRERFGLAHDQVRWTRGANRGAILELIGGQAER